MLPLSRDIQRQIKRGYYTQVKMQVTSQKDQVNALCYSIFSRSQRCVIEFIDDMPHHLFTHIDEEYAQSPLILAINFENVDAVNLMIKKGADVQSTCPLGENAMYYANKTNNPQIIALVKNAQIYSWFCCC